MAATVNYKYPVSGTTPPTFIQALPANTIQAEVVFGDADTTATITHNWQVSAADLAAYFPTVSFVPNGSGTGGLVLATIIAALTNSIAVTLTKASTAAGSAVTLVVTLTRPHSIVR